MGKNTSFASSNLNADPAVVDVHHKNLHNQVDDTCDTIVVLENQQVLFQKSLDQLSDSNTTFQNTMTSQFATFQSLLLDELHLFKSALPPTLPITIPATSTPATIVPPTANPNPQQYLQPSFRSLFPPSTTTYTGLGLSNLPTLNPLPTYTPSTRPTPSPNTITNRPTHSQLNLTSSSNFSPHPYTLGSSFSHSFHVAPSPTPTSTTHTHPTPYTYQYPPNHVKSIKMELLRFNGEDPNGWLAMAEHYLDYYEGEAWVVKGSGSGI